VPNRFVSTIVKHPVDFGNLSVSFIFKTQSCKIKSINKDLLHVFIHETITFYYQTVKKQIRIYIQGRQKILICCLRVSKYKLAFGVT